MTSPLRDQVALITGAGGGLGRQLALELARAGSRVAAVDLDASSLEELVAEIGADRAAWAVADITNRAALTAAVASLERRLGTVDLLIANAGIAQEMTAMDFHAADLERLVRVNLIGAANSIEAVLPGMLRRGRGHLVAISSLASYRGSLYGAGYCASKAGLNALMDSLRAELQPLGIHCTTVCPGWIRTPLAQRCTLSRPMSMDADRAARRIVRALERRPSFVAFPFVSRLIMAALRSLPNCIADPWTRGLLGRKRAAREPADDQGQRRAS